MFSKQKFSLVLALAMALPQLAAADTTFSNATTAVKKPEPKLTDYLGMDITSYYYGSSVTAPGSPYQPTADGYDDLSNPNLFQTRFRPAYKVTDAIKIGPVFEWNYSPVNGGDYHFGNIFIRLVHSKVYDGPQFKIYGESRFYFPTTEKSQNADMIFGARAYLDMTYAVPKTAWTLGYEHYVRGNIWGTNVGEGSRLVEYWAGAYANYDFTPQWSAKAEIDGGLYSATGSNDLQTDSVHLRAGFGWAPNDWLSLAPHLYAPTSDFSWSATVVNLEAWVKVF
jgi:hypothetical protein